MRKDNNLCAHNQELGQLFKKFVRFYEQNRFFGGKTEYK